jgi:phosphoglycolate phosphatase
MRDATILFDLDGTLVDSAPDLIRATNHTLEAHGVTPVDGDIIRPMVGFGARAMLITALRSLDRQTDEAELIHMLDVFFPYYFDHLSDETQPFPGAPEAARMLSEAGARLGVCTNKRETNARKLLTELGLADLFGVIAGGDTFAVKKPHPAHVLGTIDLLRGDATRAVMVGDTSADAEAARAAHVPFIAVSFGYTEGSVADLAADAVIDSFNELPTVVRRLLS